MTPNRRIFLNIIATYGRSLYALVAGALYGAVGVGGVGAGGVMEPRNTLSEAKPR